MHRRAFLVRTGAAIGAAALAAATQAYARRVQEESAEQTMPPDWKWIRQQFDLEPGFAHFAGFFLASHPKPVRDAIEGYRRQLDANPVQGWLEHHEQREAGVAAAAAEYLGMKVEEIALTDSTTMGLGLIYSGLRIREDQQILTTEHDHYSTRTALEFGAVRNRAQIVESPLYRQSSKATEEELVESLVKRINSRTRIVALTWVHSKTGLRMPVKAIAEAIRPFNRERDDADRILLCLDGVHGLGAVPGDPQEMGCDFFIAGTHKWMFGPRGTGIVWGRPDAWTHATPTIPPFGPHDPPGLLHTPGGFHSFEHRWALDEAFLFHQRVGKQRIYDRIRTLNTRLKQGLAEMRHITLLTPMEENLSAGIICFDVDGMSPRSAVSRLREQGIIASVSPYDPPCPRLSAGLLNDEHEVDRALAAVHRLS